MSTHSSGARQRSGGQRSAGGGGKTRADAAVMEERAQRAEATAATRLESYRKAHDAIVRADYAEAPLLRAERAYTAWETSRARADAARNRAEIAKGGHEAEIRQSLPERFHPVGEAALHGAHVQYLEDVNTHEVYRRAYGTRDIRWESVNPWNSEQKLFYLTGDTRLRSPQALRRTQTLVREQAVRDAARRTRDAEERQREVARRANDAEINARYAAQAQRTREAEDERKAAQRARANARARERRAAKRAAST